jgi:hypothetical protein
MRKSLVLRLALVLICISLLPTATIQRPLPAILPAKTPVPLLAPGHAVDWWFVFKLNAGKFPDCGGAARACPFGGTVEKYRVGQQYVFASSESPALNKARAARVTPPTIPSAPPFTRSTTARFII